VSTLRRDVDAAIREELRLHQEAAPDAPAPEKRLGDAPVHVRREGALCYLTLNRPEAQNSLNAKLVGDILAALEQAEADPSCRMLVLQGTRGVFCSGMDLEEASALSAQERPGRSPYMNLLKRFASSPLLVLAAVDGKVLAGGVGLASASDVLLATPASTFGLSEALFGLLPAQLMPYLVRRVGFQTAYRMTLTTAPITAADAQRVGLTDEVCEDLDTRLRWYARRLAHVPRETIADAKSYFRKMWLIDERMEETAVAEFNRLVRMPSFVERVQRFLGATAPTEKE
jgi:polyketide biosynthesis enoyl-CoA hydratase PksH